MPWLDAAWHPASWIEAATIPYDASDRGLLLGDGIFDTSLVLGGRMVWRAAHLRRLSTHARVLGFDVDPARLEAAVDGSLATLNGGHGALRLTLTRGPGRRGLAPPDAPQPTILATLAPLPAAALFAPLKLHATTIRRNETSPLSRVKSLCYGDGVLAAAEARAAGCDDALFLNGAGHIACAGAGNLFVIFGDAVVTPPLDDGVLDGIARAMLLAIARRTGLPMAERSLAPADLEDADAVVCTSSLRLVAPVLSIGRAITAGRTMTFETLVADAVKSDVGIDPRLFAER